MQEVKNQKQISELSNRKTTNCSTGLQEFKNSQEIEVLTPLQQTQQTLNTQLHTKDFIVFNKKQVTFSKTLFPGSIDEVELQVGLKDDFQVEQQNGQHLFFLRAYVICKNSQFDDLDQYVFSLRANQKLQYYEQIRIHIQKNQRIAFKIAVKIPIVNTSYTFNGLMYIQLENAFPYVIPVTAYGLIPKIHCLKELYDSNIQSIVIKLPVKIGVRGPVIPFKNLNPYNITFDLQLYPSQKEKKNKYILDVMNTVNAMSGQQFFVMIILKMNNQVNQENAIFETTVRKILIMKLHSSSVVFSYPLQFTFIQGKPILMA